MTDFHSHILPGIDDGAKDIQTSKKMLELEVKSGVRTIVATPHFYLSQQSVAEFYERREAAFEKILPAAQKMGVEIVCGAEVYYTPSLIDADLSKLCIGGTRYMMIELPYSRLTDSFIRSFHSFLGSISSEITPILAHAERYLSFTDENSLYEVLNADMLVQLNSASFKPFSRQLKFMTELLQHDMAHLIGTDCHNTTNRPPNIDIARKMIEKKFSRRHFDHLMYNAELVLAGETLGE